MSKKRNRRKGEIPPGAWSARQGVPPLSGESLDSKQKLVNGITDLDNGVMMTTSEILDFADGTDSGD